jgi:hypothetical protein
MDVILVITLVWSVLIVFGLLLLRSAAMGDRDDERRRRSRAGATVHRREVGIGLMAGSPRRRRR